MMSILKKTNAPYLVSGALATGTLLVSGIFAVAPYIGFLAPVEALSLGLPFIIGGVIFSVAAIALSAVIISKNNTISEKEAQLTEKEKDKNFQIASREEIILKCMKEISEKDAVVRAKEQESAKKNGEIHSPKGQQAEDEDIFYDTEPGEEKDAEISNLESQPIKEENSRGLGASDEALCNAKSNTSTALNGATTSPVSNSTCLGSQM